MPKEDRSSEVFAMASLFFALTWLAVGVRVYVRASLMKTWGKDDSYMIAALAVFTIYLPCQITAAIHGTGRHRWVLSDENAKTALLFWYLCELFYVLTSCLLKFSIGYFYLRVAIERWHIMVIKLLMVGTVLFGLVYFFLVMLQCHPISEFWNNHPASDKCIPRDPTLGITYALAVVNALADWILGLLPFFIVWGLDLKKKTKLLVAGILAFAAIGSTGTVIRMAYIHTLEDGPDFLYATTDVAIWSTVEPGIGITAGSIATFRPLIRHCMWLMGRAETPRGRQRSQTYDPTKSERRRKDRPPCRRSLSPSDLVPTELGITTTEIHGPRTMEDGNAGRSPRTLVTDTYGPAGTNRIMQTMTVEQEYEGPPTLQLRQSLRNSFFRRSIISLSRFRLPD